MGYTRIRTYAVAVLFSFVLFGVAQAADIIVLNKVTVEKTTHTAKGDYDIDKANQLLSIEHRCYNTTTKVTTVFGTTLDTNLKTWAGIQTLAAGKYDVTGRLLTKPKNANTPMYFTDSNSKPIEVE